MKNRSVKLLGVVLCITSVLLWELGTPAPGQSEEFWNGTVTSNVNLRNAPSLQGAIIKGLLKGSPVKIYEEQDGWFRVSAQKYHQVFRGWVSIEFVEITTGEPSVAAPAAEVPTPEPQAQPLPPAEESLQPAPPAAPEKPLPPPKAETPPPEPESQPAVIPEPEPKKRAVEKPPEMKPAAPKPERQARVAKAPAADPAASPADDWMQMIPMALPVVAIIVLLIAIIIYRVKRGSGKKAGEPAAPVEWSTPLDGGEQAPAVRESFEEALSRPLEDDLSEPFEEALSPSLEKDPSESLEEALSPSLEDDLSDSFGEDLSPSLEDDLSESFEEDLSPSLEDDLSESFEEALSPSLEDNLSESLEEDLSPLLEDDLSESLEEDLSPSLEEELGESFEEDLSPSLEEELGESSEEDLSPSLEEALSESLEQDLSPSMEAEPSPPLEEAQSQPLEEALAENLDFQMDFTATGSETDAQGDSPIKVVSVYDQLIEIINRMSNTELTELLGLVNSQLGEKSRQDDRLTFYSMVDFVVDGQYYRDFVQDLSASGVFIRGRHMFEPGQAILMTFMSPFFQKPFKISGEIVRILDSGIGVKFDKESQVQAEALSALIKQISMLEESGQIK